MVNFSLESYDAAHAKLPKAELTDDLNTTAEEDKGKGKRIKVPNQRYQGGVSVNAPPATRKPQTRHTSTTLKGYTSDRSSSSDEEEETAPPSAPSCLNTSFGLTGKFCCHIVPKFGLKYYSSMSKL